ncbi:MAG: GNAT family N-acetyltransferase [Mycobacteriales bacterium]
MAVHPDHQHRGLAPQLLARALERLAPVRQVWLGSAWRTQPSNRPVFRVLSPASVCR